MEASKDAKWQEAMEDTWDLVDPPENYKPIDCMWVYKLKYNADGLVNKYKTILVAKGYT